MGLWLRPPSPRHPIPSVPSREAQTLPKPLGPCSVHIPSPVLGAGAPPHPHRGLQQGLLPARPRLLGGSGRGAACQGTPLSWEPLSPSGANTRPLERKTSPFTESHPPRDLRRGWARPLGGTDRMQRPLLFSRTGLPGRSRRGLAGEGLVCHQPALPAAAPGACPPQAWGPWGAVAPAPPALLLVAALACLGMVTACPLSPCSGCQGPAWLRDVAAHQSLVSLPVLLVGLPTGSVAPPPRFLSQKTGLGLSLTLTRLATSFPPRFPGPRSSSRPGSLGEGVRLPQPASAPPSSGWGASWAELPGRLAPPLVLTCRA